jgi:large subunit ribosomal protein L6
MSRIGKKPISLPAGIAVRINGGKVTVEGPKGVLVREIHPDISVRTENGNLIVSPHQMTKKTPALWGLSRSLIANMVEGVLKGFEKKLEFEGIGYRAALEGNALQMQLGFSHPVRLEAPSGITLRVEKNTIVISGADKEKVGETAAKIRALKPPEPYKGKGIRYQGEIVKRKAGKKAVAAS